MGAFYISVSIAGDEIQDAAARGAWDGITLTANVVAQLIAFVALVAIANALIGSFNNYTEIDAFSEVKGRRNIAEFYANRTEADELSLEALRGGLSGMVGQ